MTREIEGKINFQKEKCLHNKPQLIFKKITQVDFVSPNEGLSCKQYRSQYASTLARESKSNLENLRFYLRITDEIL